MSRPLIRNVWPVTRDATGQAWRVSPVSGFGRGWQLERWRDRSQTWQTVSEHATRQMAGDALARRLQEVEAAMRR